MKRFLELHRFFVKESKSFVGVWDTKYYTKWYEPFTVYFGRYRIKSLRKKLYWPIAYIKFMWYSRKDFINP